MEQLIQQWLEAKATEAAAVEARRKAEDALTEALKVDNTKDATSRYEILSYNVEVKTRMNRKIDADKLQEVAAEHGLTEHLGSLFRWKPEIDAKTWKSASEEITRPLLQAITTTAGRPSFAITAIYKE